MGLSAIIAELEAAVTARVAGVQYLTGARHLAAAGVPPRIVWIPLRETVDLGKARSALPAATLMARMVVVGAHLWGETFDSTEALLCALLASAHESARGSFDPGSVEWVTDSHTDRGFAVTVELAFSVPVLGTAAPTVQPTAVALDPGGAAINNTLESGDA